MFVFPCIDRNRKQKLDHGRVQERHCFGQLLGTRSRSGSTTGTQAVTTESSSPVRAIWTAIVGGRGGPGGVCGGQALPHSPQSRFSGSGEGEPTHSPSGPREWGGGGGRGPSHGPIWGPKNFISANRHPCGSIQTQHPPTNLKIKIWPILQPILQPPQFNHKLQQDVRWRDGWTNIITVISDRCQFPAPIVMKPQPKMTENGCKMV